MSDFSPEQLAALTEAITKLNDAVNPAQQSLLNFGNAASGAASAMTGVNLDPLSKAAKQASIEASTTAKAVNLLGKAAGQYTDAFLSAKNGTGKYAESVSSAGDAIQTFGAALGPVGKAATLAAGALFKLAASSLKQNDTLISAYRTMSNIGNIDMTGTQGTLDLMNQMGASTKNVEYFLNVMKDIAPEMTAFGGSVSQGSKKFAEMGVALTRTDLEYKFKELGLSTEDMVKYSGQYVNDQTKYGMAQGKSTGQLTAGFLKLMQVSTDLADITGQSRDAQMEQMAVNQRDARWKMHLLQVGPVQAAKDEEMLRSAQAVSKGAGELLKDQMSSLGGVTSQQTAMLRNQYGSLYDMSRQAQQTAAKNGTEASGEFLKLMKGNVGQMTRFRQSISGSGFIPVAESLENLAAGVDTMDAELKLRGMSEEKLTQITKGHIASQDKRLKYDVIQERSERESNIMQDRMTYAMGNLAVPAVTGLAWITNKTNVGMAKLLKTVSGGEMDYTDQFRSLNTLEDANDVLLKSKREEIQLLKERKELDKEIQDNDQKILDAESRGRGPGKDLLERRDALRQRRMDMNERSSANQQTQQRAQQAQVGMTNSAELDTVKDGALAGITMKKGDVTRDPSKIDPKLIEMAKQIQKGIPGFKYFSAFNDKFHMDRNSTHNSGKALDFTLDHWPSREEGAEIAAKLKAMGATNVIDEYNNPSSGATAGHFHAQTARFGGEFKGPESGYPVELHGHEAVVPMSKFNNFFKTSQESNSTVTKDTLHSSTFAPQTNNNVNVNFGKIMGEFVETLSVKLDDLIYEQRQSKQVQEQMLTAVKH